MNSIKRKVIIIGLIVAMIYLSGDVYGSSAELPEFYGIYLLQGEKIVPLKQGNLQFRTGLALADIKSGLYGIPAPPDIKVDVAPVEIIFFDPEISPKKVRLSILDYVQAAPANFFDIKKSKTAPQYFRNVYGVSYNKQIQINLYCVERDIPLSIAPVEQKPGMYRLLPQSTLKQAIYAVNLGSVGGPTYYIGNLKFYPFVFGEIKTAPKPTMESRPQRISPKACFISQLYD